jgi:hypothetical protein
MARAIKYKRHTIDHKLLDKFLGHVLDRYKAGKINHRLAVNRIAFLVTTVALSEEEGSNPTHYMQSVLAGKLDD